MFFLNVEIYNHIHILLGLSGCKTIFVRNLPYDIEEEEVKQALSVCGKVGQVRLAIWNHTKRKKGFGYVDFINGSSAEVAVNKQGTFKVRGGSESACMYLTAKYFMYPNIGFGLSFLQLKGRVLQLDYDVGKPRSSFKLEDGRAWKKTKPNPKDKKK